MEKNQIISQAPGRINIIGEHTDYNEGYVLPAAIDKISTFHISRNGTESKVNFEAKNLNETYSFDLNKFSPIGGGWQNYVMGVVHELQVLGGQLSGFDANFQGDVPIGSGMSSSAALECSLAAGLNELFDLGFDKWQLIKASQMAEHNFVGIKCGIMDQFASVMGKKNQVMLLDCKSLEFEYFPLDLKEYQILLLNTNVSHALATSEYNTRRSECEQGVSILKRFLPAISSLRNVSIQNLETYKEHLSDNVYRRCRHIILENDRVLKATESLKSGDIEMLGSLIYESHHSLSDDYEVSCKELDFLVGLTTPHEYILGSRMMGGGFGGCTINIIHKDKVDTFIKLASQQYLDKFNVALTPYQVSIEDGAKIIEA